MEMKNRKNKILLLYAHPMDIGGVANFYKLLSKYYENSKYEIFYNRVGRIKKSRILSNNIVRFITLLFDYLLFAFKINNLKPDVIHVNPSLNKKAILRDSFYIFISKYILRDVKIITHIHGWQDQIAKGLNHKKIVNTAFKYLFNKSDKIIVLATRFKNVLVNFFNEPEKIHVIYAAVNAFDFDPVFGKQKNGNSINVLFMSRFVKAKGIYEIVDSIDPITKMNPNTEINFLFAGDGEDKLELEEYINKLNLGDKVRFLGYLKGTEKRKAYLESDIFLFPSYYGEGCPAVILEAMAAGLPVITTKVGALEDIIENYKNGIIINEKSVNEIIEGVHHLISNGKLRDEIGKINKIKAQNEFDVSIVFNKINSIYDDLLTKVK